MWFPLYIFLLMAMSDNAYAPAYAHVAATGQSKAMKPKIPEQIELLALSSDSCSTYPPERTSPSAVSAVLSPTNNGSVFNYGPVANQQRRYIQQRHLPQYPPGSVPVHVAQLSPPTTLHQNHIIQQQPFQQQIKQQPVQLSPTTSESEIIKALSHALVGQHQVQAQQQQQINLLQQQQQQRQQTLQMNNNELLKRRLSRWEKLTNQNRNYLLSLNSKEDQFRAICALSLLAVPEPQY